MLWLERMLLPLIVDAPLATLNAELVEIELLVSWLLAIELLES